jgi:hypothetical protein
LEVLSWIKVTEQAKSLPQIIDLNAFKALVQRQELELMNEEIVKTPSPEDLKPDTLARWERNWSLIKDHITESALLYDRKKLNYLINNLLVRDTKITRFTVRRIFIRYWQRGMTKLAVIPDYVYSGGRDKVKKSSELKRGRPPIFTKSKLNIDEKIRKLIIVGYEKYYLECEGSSLKRAYESFIALLYLKKGDKINKFYTPTFAQFRYWGEQEFTKLDRLKRKVGTRNINKDHKIITDSSRKDAIGPGSLFQIDSTPSDLELVSEINRDWLTGSPTLYLVCDVFTGTIAGFHVSYESPSYFVAMLALANAIEDKKEFCAKYGIEIEASDWPSKYLPNEIVADRGELLGNQADNLVSEFGITVANTAAYRPDMKGLVERHFQTVHNDLKLHNKVGHKGSRHGERGVRNARLDACLTLKEYIRIIIWAIIKYNSTTLLSNYPLDRDMVKDKLKPVPNLLWQWGLINRTGALREINNREFLFRLLPKHKVSLTIDGIKFLNNFYNLSKGPKELVNEIAVLQVTTRKEIEISYHPWDITDIYYKYKGHYIVFSISESRSPIGIGLDFWTVDQHNITVAIQTNQHNEEVLEKRVHIIQETNQIITDAKQKPKVKRSPSNAKKVRINKNIERDLNRDKTISEGRANEEKNFKEELNAKSHTSPSETIKDYKFPTFLNDLEDLIN